MKSLDDWRRFRRNLLGLSLILAPLLMLISNVASLGFFGDDPAEQLAGVADNSARYYAGNMVGVLGALFAVGAVLALIHLVRMRRPLYAAVAGGIALVGTLMMPGTWATITVVEYQMAQQADRAPFVALLEGLEESAALIPLFVTWIGTAVGMVLLAGGLWLARSVPRWMAALVAVAFVATFAAQTPLLGVLASALVLVALGAIGLRVLRSPLEAWEAGDLTGEPPMAAEQPAQRDEDRVAVGAEER